MEGARTAPHASPRLLTPPTPPLASSSHLPSAGFETLCPHPLCPSSDLLTSPQVLANADPAVAAAVRRARRLCPKTAALLDSLGAATDLARCGVGECTFSALGPGAHLRPHCGSSNARLTAHLPLLVPEGACAIRVADESRPYREGTRRGRVPGALPLPHISFGRALSPARPEARGRPYAWAALGGPAGASLLGAARRLVSSSQASCWSSTTPSSTRRAPRWKQGRLPCVSSAPGLPARRLSHGSGFSSHPRWGLHHQVWNRSASEVRVVLLIRFWHPDVPPDEYKARKRGMDRSLKRHKRAALMPPLFDAAF